MRARHVASSKIVGVCVRVCVCTTAGLMNLHTSHLKAICELLVHTEVEEGALRAHQQPTVDCKHNTR
jgi:hypothetical protein